MCVCVYICVLFQIRIYIFVSGVWRSFLLHVHLSFWYSGLLFVNGLDFSFSLSLALLARLAHSSGSYIHRIFLSTHSCFWFFGSFLPLNLFAFVRRYGEHNHITTIVKSLQHFTVHNAFAIIPKIYPMDADFDDCGFCKHLSNDKIYTFQNIIAEIWDGVWNMEQKKKIQPNNNRKSF